MPGSHANLPFLSILEFTAYPNCVLELLIESNDDNQLFLCAAGVSKRTAEHNQPFFFCSSLPLTPHFKTFVKHIIRDDDKAVWMGSVNAAPLIAGNRSRLQRHLPEAWFHRPQLSV